MTDNTEHIERDRQVLEECSLFLGIGNLALAEVTPALECLPFEAGGHVFLEGEKGSALFIIAEGSVRVTKRMPDGHKAVVAQLGSGDVFGEMALVTHAPRSTDCVFDTAGRLWRLPRNAFDGLRESAPNAYAQILRNLGRTVCKRLSRTTGEVCNLVFDLKVAASDKKEIEEKLGRSKEGLKKIVTSLERPTCKEEEE